MVDIVVAFVFGGRWRNRFPLLAVFTAVFQPKLRERVLRQREVNCFVFVLQLNAAL